MRGVTPLHGPEFSTFSPDAVTWLLDDLSDLALEAPVDEREKRKALGLQHYSDDLPIELPTTESFMAVFQSALPSLATSAASMVQKVALDLAARGRSRLALVSLARAGVPPATWLKESLAVNYGQASSHYAVSIVKDLGLDQRAIEYVLSRHDPEDVFFVDGWTGSGAIRSELSHSLQAMGADMVLDRLVVLCDPAGVADVYGSQYDELLPSACLNATSCGLVSRTVTVRTSAGGVRHGAKFYQDRITEDMTRVIHEHVSLKLLAASRSPDSEEQPDLSAKSHITSAIRERLEAPSVSVKWGFGESMRALQRRQPTLLVVDPAQLKRAASRPLMALATERGVPVRTLPISPYGAAALSRTSTDPGRQQ